MVRMGVWQFDLPDYFVARHFFDLVRWAQQIPTGDFEPTRLITFNEGDLAARSPDPEQGREMLGAWLFARISRRGVECEPYRESDRRMIANYCEKMMRAGVRPRDRLVEPPRPGIPGIG